MTWKRRNTVSVMFGCVSRSMFLSPQAPASGNLRVEVSGPPVGATRPDMEDGSGIQDSVASACTC